MDEKYNYEGLSTSEQIVRLLLNEHFDFMDVTIGLDNENDNIEVYQYNKLIGRIIKEYNEDYKTIGYKVIKI